MNINKRRCRLTVGDINSGAGFVVEDLRIGFEINKLAAGAPNTANITIHNLSPTYRNLIEQEYTNCILQYGTGDVLTVIFIGEIYNVITAKDNGMDVITTLYCGSGLNGYHNATIHKSFSAGTDPLAIINSVASELKPYGISIGTIDEGLIVDNGGRGVALSGAVSQVMDNLLRGTGFYWTIDDTQINLIKQQTADNSDILITPGTGLIGSVKRTYAGFDFTSVLNPVLQTGQTIGVYSDYVQSSEDSLNYLKIRNATSGGLIRLITLTHKGDNREGQAITTGIGLR